MIRTEEFLVTHYKALSFVAPSARVDELAAAKTGFDGGAVGYLPAWKKETGGWLEFIAWVPSYPS